MYIIDFEASSLRKTSYPIEVAWGDSWESVTSFLLNPDKMDGWTDWNEKSYGYHGIRREELLLKGEDPRQVAKIMIHALSGKPIYSDEPRYDRRWKDRLLADTGHDPGLIQIKCLQTYLNKLIKTHFPCRTLVDFYQAFPESKTAIHRAAADVKWLFKFIAFVKASMPQSAA